MKPKIKTKVQRFGNVVVIQTIVNKKIIHTEINYI